MHSAVEVAGVDGRQGNGQQAALAGGECGGQAGGAIACGQAEAGQQEVGRARVGDGIASSHGRAAHRRAIGHGANPAGEGIAPLVHHNFGGHDLPADGETVGVFVSIVRIKTERAAVIARCAPCQAHLNGDGVAGGDGAGQAADDGKARGYGEVGKGEVGRACVANGKCFGDGGGQVGRAVVDTALVGNVAPRFAHHNFGGNDSA